MLYTTCFKSILRLCDEYVQGTKNPFPVHGEAPYHGYIDDSSTMRNSIIIRLPVGFSLMFRQTLEVILHDRAGIPWLVTCQLDDCVPVDRRSSIYIAHREDPELLAPEVKCDS